MKIAPSDKTEVQRYKGRTELRTLLAEAILNEDEERVKSVRRNDL